MPETQVCNVGVAAHHDEAVVVRHLYCHSLTLLVTPEVRVPIAILFSARNLFRHELRTTFASQFLQKNVGFGYCIVFLTHGCPFVMALNQKRHFLATDQVRMFSLGRF